MKKAKDYLDLLGLKMKDRVTGFEGVVGTIAFDLYGCVQAALQPPVSKKDSRLPDGRWFDTSRLDVVDSVPVMARPTFATDSHGPAEKPRRQG